MNATNVWWQVIKEQEAAERAEGRGPHEAATLIQSAWRKRQAQQELRRLRQQQENQAGAAAQQVLSPDSLHLCHRYQQGELPVRIMNGLRHSISP